MFCHVCSPLQNDTSPLTVSAYCFHSLTFINIMNKYHSGIVIMNYSDVFLERVPMTGLYPL